MTAAPTTSEGRSVFALATAVAVSSGVLLALGLVEANSYGRTGDWWQWAPTALTFTVVGWLVASRQPRHPIGWLMLAFGTLFASEVATLVYSVGVDDRLTGAVGVSALADWAGWWRILHVDLLVVLLALILLLFPDGHLPSSRWRPVLWSLVAVGGATVVLLALSDVNFTQVGQDGNYLHLVDPVRLLDPATFRPVYHALQVLELLGLGAAAASLVVRFRAAVSPQREQVKWVTWAAALMALSIVAVQLTPLHGLVSDTTIVAAVGIPLVGLSIGIAVLRFRLFDIDRIISRTASYAVITGLVVATYAVVVTLATRLAPDSSKLAVAAATLAAAAVAQPGLRRVQSLVDRRFNRPRFDAQHALEEFGAGLRNAVDTDLVRGQLVSAVQSTLQPSQIDVWTRESG